VRNGVPLLEKDVNQQNQNFCCARSEAPYHRQVVDVTEGRQYNPLGTLSDDFRAHTGAGMEQS
jgi:hypothetical protein